MLYDLFARRERPDIHNAKFLVPILADISEIPFPKSAPFSTGCSGNLPA